MSTQYEAIKDASLYASLFRVDAPAELGERKMTPRKPGFCITSSLVGMTDAERTARKQEAAAASPAPESTEPPHLPNLWLRHGCWCPHNGGWCRTGSSPHPTANCAPPSW